MTNLSEELCRICGIEGKWFEYTTETTDGCVNLGKKRVFPDFTQPENFVKLIELRFTTKRGDVFTVVEALQNGRCFTFADRKSFLDQLLDYIFTCENFGEYIKQAIRETEWVYE